MIPRAYGMLTLVVLSIPANDEKRILRMVRNAARFTYYLTRAASDDSSLSVGMQLQKVNDDGLADGVDILCGGFTKVDAPEGEKRSTYCLILRNNSKVAVWPFVFVCDPLYFCICAFVCII